MSEPEASGPETTTPAPPDPWKGLRGVMAGALVLEAITVLLALPVVADIAGGVTWLSGTYLVVLALVMIVGAGLQRRSWAIPFNLGLQVPVLIGGVFHLSIAVIGVVFLAVWAFILLLRADVKKRLEEGTLPSQRAPGGS
ncbi:DUF4233 domain-containing protein [Nocardia sp. NBC_01329]|uniref:DUF4233 domain-containing protein n=1 Tax=Nocardia sp. NBC_01329 TaxID=2903594 RepID=UPI002E123481|nr:DUF4233 domain-containing protein [Nocardia sp. NBC_01329]